jgi:transcriptional regulator with XRE-family HTH domain
MQGLCYSLDKRTGNLPPVKNVKQIHLIGPQLKGKLCQAYSPFPTLLLYNFSYGKVITHVEKYNKNFVFVKREKQKFVMKAGERIRALRKVLGLTQKEFADRIGITYQMLGLYERGKYEPSEKVLKLISSTFGVSYEWLKTGQGEMWERKEKTLLEELEAKTKELLEKLVRIPVVGACGCRISRKPSRHGCDRLGSC